MVTRRRNRSHEKSQLKRVRTNSLKNNKRVQREKGKVKGKVEENGQIIHSQKTDF